jgi:spore germination cell wall hydrolase CwlJ-like protein
MKFLLKTAPAAVVSLTLLGGAAYSDAGFAFGASNGEKLSAQMITIDPDMLVADQAALDAATTDTVSVTTLENGDIVFTPGTGAPVPAAEIDSTDDADKADSLAELVRAKGEAEELDAEARCLAGAVYFEAKGESLEGQLAVARVVMARTKSGRFPTSLCGVVHQKSQFSFIRGGKMPSINTDSLHWRNAVAITQIALDDSWKSPVEGALFFHARHVSPGWRLKRLGSIDNHIFYR